MVNNEIIVSSHVARDFLQNSAYFNTLPKVVWEYVSNSLDNAKEDVPITVNVELTSLASKKLVIADNGLGMSKSDLTRFFQMHGENVQRKKGKRVRGRFGTGKSAAFGIANTLEIDTVKNGFRNVVRLTRKMIENAVDGSSFPVEIIIDNEKIFDDNNQDGTKVFISDFIDGKINFEKTIQFIERNLSRYKQRATVIINGHTCKFTEPAYTKIYNFSPETSELKEKLGSIDLIIKVSPKPLDAEFVGVDILSYGIWHETTLAESENKEFSNWIFGEVDVEKLEDDNSSIPPFDNTRNNQLNRANPTVVTLLAWVGQHVEEVRKEIVKQEEERKKSEQYKKLQESSKALEKILNADFLGILDQYELARRITSTQIRKVQEIKSTNGEVLPGEGDFVSHFTPAGYERGDGKSSSILPPGEGEIPREMGPNLITGDHLGSPKEMEQTDSQRKVKRGVFSVSYIEGSPEDKRSEYKKDERTIYINLNHPQIVAAKNNASGILDSKEFKELTYEIAVVEYALAVQYERAENEDLDTFDALFEVGSIVDRVTRKITEALL